jgi:uncharacterized protein
MSSEASLPFLDLFTGIQRAMQPIGVALDLEQYDLLRQALGLGFGVASWENDRIESWANLRRLCQRIWVKPIPSYDEALKVFDRAFSGYMEEHLGQFDRVAQPVDVAIDSKYEPEIQWPDIPLRKGTQSQPDRTGKVQVAGAIATAKPPAASLRTASGYRLTPQDFPLTLPKMQQNWRSLRRSVPTGNRTELDLDATIARILQQGFFDDVVMRPITQQKAELIVLIDDNEPMQPFAGAIAPLVQAIEDGWIGPATIYRFTTFPQQYLYSWRRASQAIAIDQVLSRCHPTRTVMLIVSDGGAALGSVSGAMIVGMQDFVARSRPCIRQLIWLNPLPSERWQGCSAQVIAHGLAGRMVELDRFEPAVLHSRELGGVLV